MGFGWGFGEAEKQRLLLQMDRCLEMVAPAPACSGGKAVVDSSSSRRMRRRWRRFGGFGGGDGGVGERPSELSHRKFQEAISAVEILV